MTGLAAARAGRCPGHFTNDRFGKIPALVGMWPARDDSIVGNEILTILCPDWRTATLVIDATDSTVVFANSQCISMFRRGTLVRLSGDRLSFVVADLNRRFESEVSRLKASGGESAYLFGRDLTSEKWLSVTIRNGQGFFRDAVESSFGNLLNARLMIVEIATVEEGLDPHAFASFAQIISLSKAEADLVEAVVAGDSLRQAADRRSAALSTVRQRMKNILAKTGCRRQSELVTLVLSLCPRRGA
jgi:DNA-binding CsgD family transcriptional regulator